MQNLRTLLLSLVFSVLAQAADPAPLISDADFQRLGFRKHWEARLPVPEGRDVTDAFLVDEILYATIDDGSIFAIQADVGLIRWADELTEPDFTIFPPTHVRTKDGKGPVVIPTTTRTFFYDRYGGARLGGFRPPFAPGGPMIGVEGFIFSGSTDGHFYAIVACPENERAFKAWEVFAGGPITAAPILTDAGQLILASENGRVYSCLARDKTYLWSFCTDGPIVGDPAIDPSGVYVASGDRSLYKVDRLTGREIWRARFHAPLREGPAVAAHTVYQYCELDGLTAVDADTGKERWRLPSGWKLASHSPAGDVVFTTSRGLQVVESETGNVRGEIAVPGALDVVTNTSDDAVYVLGTQGRVVCFRLDEIPYLRRQQVQSARQQLNLPPLERSNAANPEDKTDARTPSRRDENPFRSSRDQKP